MLERLEPDDGKLSCPVLRGRGGGNVALLPDNIATDSDGETHTGAVVERIRKRRAGRRAAGQAVGTKSAKRRLKQLAGRQRRFQANENHRISKQVVAKAKHTKRAIALEELSGIRTRVRVRGTE